MAVKVKLEKDGFKKDAYVGFSWTTLFLGIWVPSFRLDLKGFLTFLGIMLLQTATLLFVIINALKNSNFEMILIFFFLFFALGYIINFFLAIFYNKTYTKNMLLDGWRPMDNDEYSLAILSAYKFIEYEIDTQDEEKIARFKKYISKTKNEERSKWVIFILPLIIMILSVVATIGGLIIFLRFMSRFAY